MGSETTVCVQDPDRIDRVAEEIVAAAKTLYRALGPGRRAEAYGKWLAFELMRRGLDVKPVDLGGRADLLVAGRVVVQARSVERLEAIHAARMLAVLRVSGRRLGLLINFDVPSFEDGLCRVWRGD